MDVRSISSKNLIPVIDPTYLRQSPDEFLAENGGFLSEVVVIAKATSGFVHFRSTTAPGSKEANEFFSTFASIADSIGIKVHALVNGFADVFFAKNQGYSAIKDGGNPSNLFVDPFKSSYTNYLNSVISEIIDFPVYGILLDNLRFPSEHYSFCENCCRIFAEQFGMDRIFSLHDLQKDNRIFAEWLSLRRNRIGEIAAEIADTVSRKPNISLNFTLDIDPTLGAEKGALRHFGQDINIFAKYGTPTLHISAWTPYPNSVSSSEYKHLSQSLIFAKKFQEQTQRPINLYLWGIENESALSFLDTLKGEIAIQKVFILNHFPIDYQKRREVHLSLS